MRLKSARVRLYRNIIDSGDVPIEDSITCLVGKNESGKTAFLQALYSLNPSHPHLVEVDVVRDYPRWRKVRDERQFDLTDIAPIVASFELDAEDRDALKNTFPFPLPASAVIQAERTYGKALRARIVAPERDWVEALVDASPFEHEDRSHLRQATSLEALSGAVRELKARIDKRRKLRHQIEEFETVLNETTACVGRWLADDELSAVQSRIPLFFYFSTVSGLDGRIDLTRLLQKSQEQLRPSEQTAIALLRLAGVQGKELITGQFESRIAELEAAASEITSQVLEYWSQNTDLIVQFQTDSETVSTPQGQSVVHRYLDIRLNDLRHHMTTNFSTRSTGFQWFFSFIVAFSEFEKTKNLVILLDEPGLGLHARAQGDLLRFIEERLASGRQVVYTTHSPFMVNPKRLDRVRLVEDLTTRENPDRGAQISTDVLAVRPDTLFPLQAALGYDLAQNLFVGGFNLVVEGPSDLIYLSTMSELLQAQGRTGLDSRVTLVPVGGADKIPTFVALLGAHLDVSVLVDANVSKSQKLQDMINGGLLHQQRLVSVGQVTGARDSSLEDLFSDDEYVGLYNEAFTANIDLKSLPGNDSIVRRLERATGSKFDHLRPAVAFLRKRDELVHYLSAGTLARFERLFQLINATFPR